MSELESGFGFGTKEEVVVDDGKPKELEHKYSQTLKAKKWEFLTIGLKVQSVRTGAKGKIVDTDATFANSVDIDWDNGNESRGVKHNNLDKVIVLEE